MGNLWLGCLELLGKEDGIVEGFATNFGDGDAEGLTGGGVARFFLRGGKEVYEDFVFHDCRYYENLYKDNRRDEEDKDRNYEFCVEIR